MGALWAAMRPRQWVKNFLVLAALVFGRRLFVAEALTDALLGFVAFCMVSSAGYLVNDLKDLEHDRRHPSKRARPLAEGRLGVGGAVVAAVVLALGGAACGLLVGRGFALALGAYAAVSLAYTLLLKRVVIVDVFAVAAGFVLRAAAGALAVGVELSGWLLVCTTLGALLVGFGKRRNELLLLKETAEGHRRVLEEYNLRFLDMMIGIAAASSVMSYALYTASEETAARFHTRAMFLTLPFVLYGIFRYLFLVYCRGRGGDPVETALTDRATLANALLWAATVVVILYLR
ncbi:MAG TPA: decaprenyl-phosphate phosphoribosyltransferase [Pyrinomonadaceae bacterium]|nr:decaprenyl-phosphate phosphoribosyltransferase [Pyrinomonadaceae bacterium]